MTKLGSNLNCSFFSNCVLQNQSFGPGFPVETPTTFCIQAFPECADLASTSCPTDMREEGATNVVVGNVCMPPFFPAQKMFFFLRVPTIQKERHQQFSGLWHTWACNFYERDFVDSSFSYGWALSLQNSQPSSASLMQTIATSSLRLQRREVGTQITFLVLHFIST